MQDQRFSRFAVCMLAALLSLHLAYGGNYGKIVGRVTDKETREALVGANILILGTSLGATTDSDGRYVILKVPPGYIQRTCELHRLHGSRG